MKLSLGRLPELQTVKLTVTLTTELRDQLLLFSKLYGEALHESISPEQLIPPIVALFLSKDKAFKAALKKQSPPSSKPANLEST